MSESGVLVRIPTHHIQRGQFQPRRVFDRGALEELAESIRGSGLIEPIIVRPMKNPSDPVIRYEIVAGERRWRAVMLLGMDLIDSIVRDYTDEQTAIASLRENMDRESLNVIEEAEGVQYLMDTFGYSQVAIASNFKKFKSVTKVSHLLRVLSLRPKVKDLICNSNRAITLGHARALVGLGERDQYTLACKIVEEKLSVRQVENLSRNLKNAQDSPSNTATSASNSDELVDDANIKRFEVEIAEKLATPVAVQHKQKGGGQLIINYYSVDQLQGIVGRF